MIKELSLSIGQLLGISTTIAILVALCICACWSIVFNRIKEGQKAEFQKQIEELKAKQDKLNYITKTQFDTEFKIYQELSEAMFHSVLKSYLLFPNGLDKVSTDSEERQEEYKKRYKEATETLFNFQDLVFKYAAFIEESLYKQFDEVRLLIQLNVNYFPDIRLRDDLHLPADVEMDCFNRTKEISDKQDIIIQNLRKYLQSFKIKEDN